MKFGIVFMLLFGILNAKADSPINLICASPTTVFTVFNEKEKVYSIVDHPNGVQFTPMYTGGLPMVSVERVLRQEEVIRALGDQQTFVWPADKCTLKNEILYCTNGEHQKLSYTTNVEVRKETCVDPKQKTSCKVEISYEAVTRNVEINPIVLRSITDNLVMASGEFDVYNMSVVFLVKGHPDIPDTEMLTLSSNYMRTRDCSISGGSDAWNSNLTSK